MHSQIVHNGCLGPIEACLSPGQVGLLTGWGVFTTLRIYAGVPFAFEQHWERMSRDARRLRVQLEFDPEQIRQQLLQLIAANGAREAAARLSFVRNRGGLWSVETGRETDSLLFTADLPPWPSSARLTVSPQARHAASPLASAKMLSWVDNLATLEEVRELGFDETVLLNERSEVTECTGANLFTVRQGRLLTPPLDSGCLPGVTRCIVLEVGSQLGLETREQVLRLDDLRTADEVFLSSTTRELMPVRKVDGSPLPERGPVTARLQTAFQAYVRNYVESHQRVPAQA